MHAVPANMSLFMSAGPAKPRPAAKPRVAPRKGAKPGGLGVKKLSTKVDESVFDQKPEEPPAVVPQVGTTFLRSPCLRAEDAQQAHDRINN